VERVSAGADDGMPKRRVVTLGTAEVPYHVGLDLPTGRAGDGITKHRAISEAQTQVLRGASGFASYLREEGLLRTGHATLIPVIFTTARVSVTDTLLENADLESGEMVPLQLSEPGYVWLQQNISRSLMSTDPGDYAASSGMSGLSQTIRDKRTRSVAIVTTGAVQKFFQNLDVALV
jgi:hypothetical protein